jgi:hypothetical protein
MKFISIPVDNAEAMINQHSFLKNKNEEMAKAAFTQMKEFVEAASYHQQQIDVLGKAIKDVTFMLTETKTTLSGSDGGSTSEGTSPAPSPSTAFGDGDPEKVAVRKADLISSLKAHEDQFGSFDINVDVIADFLMAK